MGAFRKGDRVVVAAVGTAVDNPNLFVGEAGTVQQSRRGGEVAIVALDNRRRVSINQCNLRPCAPRLHGYGETSDCLCGRNFPTVRGLREHLTKARLAEAEED